MLELPVWGRGALARPSRAQLGSCRGLMATPDPRSPLTTTRPSVTRPCRFSTPDSLDAYMNRAPHTVTPVSAQAAIEESFFLGLRLNRGVDLARLQTEFSTVFEPASFLKLDCHPSEAKDLLFAGTQQNPWVLCRLHDLRSAEMPSQLGNPRSSNACRTACWKSKAQLCGSPPAGVCYRTKYLRDFLGRKKVGTGHVNPR